MDILQVKSLHKFQEDPEWLPGCWREAPNQSEEVIEYFQYYLPEEMHPFFRLVQGKEDEKPTLFILIDAEDLAALGGHEPKQQFYQENKAALEAYLEGRLCGKYALEAVFFAEKERRPFRSVFK